MDGRSVASRRDVMRTGAILIAALLAACAPAGQSMTGALPIIVRQESGTDVLLQAVSAVNDTVAWVSGHEGTYARTIDGGATWHVQRVPGADSLQFRDVHAVDAWTAWLLSAGPGELSRIYHTADGGRTWDLQFRNTIPEAFFDCFAFWNARQGVAFSDAVDGTFIVIRTTDGGATWERVPTEALPPAQPGEVAFAASGTCVAVDGRSGVDASSGSAWIGTGNAEPSRVLRSTDAGRTWSASPAPLVSGAGAGITSVAFRDALHGAALGGLVVPPPDMTDMADTAAAGAAGEDGDTEGEPEAVAEVAGPTRVALTEDGGRSWRTGGEPAFPGAVYGAAWVPAAERPVLVAVGPGGASWSSDGGETWFPLDTGEYWGVGIASTRAGWIVGPGGRITKVSLTARRR